MPVISASGPSGTHISVVPKPKPDQDRFADDDAGECPGRQIRAVGPDSHPVIRAKYWYKETEVDDQGGDLGSHNVNWQMSLLPISGYIQEQNWSLSSALDMWNSRRRPIRQWTSRHNPH